jgi:methyl-accepting chemotaxis protein
MKWFLDLSTRSKLALGFGAMVALALATIAVAYRGITAARSSAQVALHLVELRSELNRQRAQIMDMMLRTAKADQEVIERDIRARASIIDDLFKQLSEATRGDGDASRKLDDAAATLKAYRQDRDHQIELIYAKNIDEAKRLSADEQHQRYEKVYQVTLELGRQAIERSDEAASTSLRLFLVLGAAALVLAAVLATFLSRVISRPLIRISGAARHIASGDLTVALPADGRADEAGTLTQNFTTMVTNLRRVLGGISEGATVLGSSASEIVASTAQLASGAAQTATALAQTATTIEEVRQTAQVTTQKAKYVADSSQKAVQTSQAGKRNTEESIEGINRIREQMGSIAQGMVRLSEQTQAIGQIIAVVDDLAQQSNLLAVNAAIEAAKAGEQGKGFAVVAQEVKSLAEQSKQATGQVRTILSDIQKATGAAAMATEQGTKAVEAGVRQSGQAGESIVALAANVAEAASAASQIAASSQQQLVGMDQVAAAMTSVKQASQQNVESARQLEAAARNLSELGGRLKELVGRYKVQA